MDLVPASDEEDILFPAPVAAPKGTLLEDPYSFESLVAAAPRRDTLQATKPPYKPITTARSPPGTRSTYQDVESISEFTREQPSTHRGSRTLLPTSSITEFSTAPSAQSISITRKHLASKSSLTSLGPTPHGRHNTTSDEFQPPPFPVINISDDPDYDGDPKAKGKRPKQDKKPRKPTEKNEPTAKAPLDLKFTNQVESDTMHQVELGIEGEVLCESKPPPRKRKAPVETAQDEPPKKKARKSPTKKLFDRDLDVLSFPDSTVLAPPILPDDVPSFLNTAKAHPKQNVVKPSEGIVPPPNQGKKAKKGVTGCGDKNAPEDKSTIELKVTKSGKKKRMSRNVQVVDSKDDTAGADASVAVLHRDQRAPTLPSKLKPVVELTTRRSKKNMVQSDEEVGLAVDAFGESEDELLMESKSTRERGKATSEILASTEGDKRGKNNASRAKPTSGETLEAQAPGPELIAGVPKQLGTSMDGARDVPQGEAASLLVPHDLAAANSNPPLPLLRDTNKSSNKLPSANLSTIEPPTPKLKRASMGHTIPKRKDSMTLLLQRTGLHAPLSSSRLTVPATARIAPLHFNRKTPPPPPLPVPKPKKKKVESEEETDEEEYMGLSERQITKLKEEKRKKAWYSP